MTNVERAAQIWCHPKLSDRVMDTEMAFVIAEALDEKDAIFRKRMDESIKVAHRLGQENMRERAAKLTEACWQPSIKDCQCPGCGFGKTIRALPIEGEVKP